MGMMMLLFQANRRSVRARALAEGAGGHGSDKNSTTFQFFVLPLPNNAHPVCIPS